ncbi:hypothetical protein MCOR29_002151 [Pyricularia oryzae]|nr:hypothetical protein MCOR26_007947 [Pyricularia oryzae]KAI6329814.1 hypothetical protein MCOR29_002151 [Pyricularia oryzae]KAI6361236.1 hypothetical protein MCOR31_008794 [Pyricularia oryzae]KAI6380400.1 hypothetical protein MCOR32_004064 [Pyricularia oryzae]KAI6474355.1 hypothetical protein MCOR17_002160 [Pyricularia oryzae]
MSIQFATILPALAGAVTAAFTLVELAPERAVDNRLRTSKQLRWAVATLIGTSSAATTAALLLADGNASLPTPASAAPGLPVIGNDGICGTCRRVLALGLPKEGETVMGRIWRCDR